MNRVWARVDEAVTEHQLLLFLVQVLALVVVARAGGEIALRLGVAQVVGELAAGILLGPSLFGALWPGGFRALFPAEPVQHNLLEIMGWLGVIFLVLLSGMETRLRVLRRASRAVILGWVGGFFLPFTLGFGFGWLVPATLVPAGIERAVFALFIGTAMSISAIPVIARILLDLDMLKGRIGTVIMSTAIADDTLGWIVLAVVSGLVLRNEFDLPAVATALIGTGAFFVLAFTAGQWLVRKVLRASESLRVPFAKTTVTLAVVFAGGAITQAIHVHLVLGCFVAGILIFRSPAKDRVSIEPLRTVGMAFFVPFFFGYTGIKVDLTTLTGSTLLVAVGAVLVACAGKFVGASGGARLGGLSWWESLAVGAGLNARGAMELVIAAIGLSIGVLSLPMYSIIVVVAVVTTLMAAPLLRACVGRMGTEPPDDGRHRPVGELSKGPRVDDHRTWRQDRVTRAQTLDQGVDEMTERDMPIRRRDDESDWHDLVPDRCERCGCTFYYAKDEPDIVWDPGQGWDEECRDRACACHEDPVIGRRRSEGSAR